jgi:hypothetical protein
VESHRDDSEVQEIQSDNSEGRKFHLMKFQDNSEGEDQSRKILRVKMILKYRKFTRDNSESEIQSHEISLGCFESKENSLEIILRLEPKSLIYVARCLINEHIWDAQTSAHHPYCRGQP